MMKLTIGSEAIFFVCLIIAYLTFWRSGHFKMEALNHLDIKTTGVFTLLLFSSSFTFWRAEKCYERNDTGGMKGWLLGTLVLGAIFLIGQGHEYYSLIKEQVTVSKSEFGSSFYALTGFHGLHVFIGLIILTCVYILTLEGYFEGASSTVIRTVGIYWHFVDAVWVFVFTTIYILPYLL
jgi:heme/copper-type cytochrome/quinol oxidase subunit 3